MDLSLILSVLCFGDHSLETSSSSPPHEHHPSAMSRDELFTDPRNPEFDIPHRFSNKSASSGDCAAVHDPTDIWAFLHDEMRGRVCLNQDSVWKQLRVDGIEVDIVRTCCKELEVACAESIQGLQEIESNVSKRSELQMYPLFVCFFAHFLNRLNTYI